MPILSTHEIARNQRSLEYFEHDGVIKHLDTGDITKFIQAGGVYFVKLLVPKNFPKGSCCVKGDKGFVRPGKA